MAPSAVARLEPRASVAANDEPGKYWAFITYSHTDERWARWLHRALERYPVPRRLVGQPTALGPAPRRLFPVFRDRDELAGSPELGPELQRALRQSRAQIVICSPAAARSHWVNEEIRYFKSLGRGDRVLALIVDGEPHSADRPDRECFPPALKFRVDATGALTGEAAEPIAADARRFADGPANAKLKLIAGLLGVPYNDLRQRELHARHRRMAIATTIACGIAGAMAVLAAQAWYARNDAVRRQQQAEHLLEFMLGDLRGKLEPIGKLAILDAVGAKAMEYFATLEPSDLTDTALTSYATALRQIGEVRLQQGDMSGAVDAIDESLRLSEELLARHPGDTALLRKVGRSQYSVGYAYYVKGDLEQAAPWWQRNAATADRLVAVDPADAEWRQYAIEAQSNLGALEFGRNHLDGAEGYFAAALTQQRALLEQEPDKPAYVENLANFHGWLFAIETARRAWPQAREQARHNAAALRRLVEQSPDHAQYRHRLAAANLQILFAEGQLGTLAPDSPVLLETERITRALTELDPENVEYAHAYAVALNYRVDAQLAAGQIDAAEPAARTMLDVVRRTYRRAPANAMAVDDLLAALAQTAKLASVQKKRALALERLREAIALRLPPEQMPAQSRSRWLDLHLLGWWLARDARALKDSAAKVDEWLQRQRAAGDPLKPELMLRYEALRGNLGEARHWAEQLDALQRAHPFTRQFCAAFDVCGPALETAAAASSP